jgi:O-methyltransferase
MRVEDSRSSAGRDVRAAPPGAEPEALRRAYLELLKLCLCDLAGSSTTSVRGLPHGRVVSRELSREELSLRAEGGDWPAHGLTMVGLRRLDDLQRCVEQVVSDGVEGDLIEAGCWRGGASILMRATLDTLGASDRTVWAADSFDGFPRSPAARSQDEPETVEPYLAAFDFLAAPLEEVRASFARLGLERGVRFIEGFFEDTLPALSTPTSHWSLVRLDADTYDPTLLALRCLYPALSPGGCLIIDDYGDVAECQAAVDRFRAQYEIREPLEWIDSSCVRWRRESEAPLLIDVPSVRSPRSAGSAAPRGEQKRVPTESELALAIELAEARERLERARQELDASRELERRFEEVTSSTSWRLTRPLRELGLRLRSLRRR